MKIKIEQTSLLLKKKKGTGSKEAKQLASVQSQFDFRTTRDPFIH